MKLRRAVSIGLGLKGVKIARNVAKVVMHAVLLQFGLKMLNIALNIMKVGMHSYFPNAELNL